MSMWAACIHRRRRVASEYPLSRAGSAAALEAHAQQPEDRIAAGGKPAVAGAGVL